MEGTTTLQMEELQPDHSLDLGKGSLMARQQNRPHFRIFLETTIDAAFGLRDYCT